MGHSHQGSRRKGQLEPQRECLPGRPHVRFGSKADILRRGSRCPLWVISRHFAVQSACPLYPQKRTFGAAVEMSAKCQ